MKKPFLTLFGGLAFLSTGLLHAGTINIDFQADGETTPTKPGLIGKGTHWGTYQDIALGPLFRDDGTQVLSTAVNVMAVGQGDTLSTFKFGSGFNDLHIDGVVNNSGPIQISLAGFRLDVPYKLVVYLTNATGTEAAVTFPELGVEKISTQTTIPSHITESVEGIDHLIFEGITTNPGTNIIQFTIDDPNVSASRIVGLQLQGWLPGEDFPSKTDLQISKKRNGGYTGDDVYGGRQLQKVTRQRRAKFYYCLENDADVCANYGLRGKASDRDAVRKWFDLTDGRENITAEVATQTYLVALDPEEKRLLLGVFRARPGTRKVVSVLRGFAAEDKSVSYADRNKAILVP